MVLIILNKIMSEQEYLTKEKFNQFKEELEYLKKEKRKEVAEKLEYAKSLGDLSENAEFHEARDTQAIVEDRIQKLENILKIAIIVESHSTDVVAVGSVITIVKDGEKGEKVYTLVGGEESDIANMKISVHSPLGRAALGKKKGDKFTFSAPSGQVTYKVVAIA